MNIREDDYLQLSGIQHFAFCKRQWALIHIEEVWEENLLTIEGSLLHKHAHDPFFSEKRKDTLVVRDLQVFSRKLGVSGKCDVVEFLRDDEAGVALFGRKGKWRPYPIEYKRGKPKETDIDRLQLCAQALCLEEMLVCRTIPHGFLFYGETRRREKVDLTDDLRAKVAALFLEMRSYYERRHTPQVRRTKSCNACSLKNTCLPQMPGSENSASSYLRKNVLQ